MTPPLPGLAEPRVGLMDILTLVLSLLVMGVVGYDTFGDPGPEVSRILDIADTLICIFFMAEFAVRLKRAPDRWAFLRWGWVDLAASIPAAPMLRWGRLLRVLYILRVFRSLRSFHRVLHPWVKSRCQTGVSVVLLTTFLVLFSSSCLILVVEDASHSNIRTAEEALWWSVTTITTVGYGDRYPVTTAGRVVGMILMFTGVGIFGLLSGMVASLFLGPPPTPATPQTSLDEVLKEVRELRARIDTGKGPDSGGS